MQYRHNFDEVINRRGTDSGKWNMFPEELLPMWVADTDFACPEPILNALKKRIDHRILGYPIVLDSFGKAAKYWFSLRHNIEIDANAVVYMPTILLGMMECLIAFTKEQDEILVFSPQYTAFFEAIENTNRVRVFSHLVEKNGRYEIDFADFEEKLAREKVKLFFLCNPHNPTGQVWSKEEVSKIAELCLKHNVLIVSDDIYSDYVYKPYTYTPVISVSEEAKKQFILLINPSKTFNIPGLRAACAIIHNESLRDTFKKSLRRRKTAEPNLLGVVAFESAYTECAWYVDELLDYVEKNIDYALAFIHEKMPKIKVRKPEGTILLWLDMRELFQNQAEADIFMLEKAKVLLNSGSDYGIEGTCFFRMNIAVPRAVLEEALTRIYNAYRESF